MLALDSRSTNAEWEFCGTMNMIVARSARSKRVATSTMAAEILQIASAVEETMYLQSRIFERLHPAMSTFDLVHVDPSLYIKADVSTDCNDAYEVLIKAAAPNISNRNLVLFVSMLRECKAKGYVRSWYWNHTEDMLADVLTKLLPNGLADLDKLSRALKSNFYEPVRSMRVDGVDHAPSAKQRSRRTKTCCC